MTAEFHIDFRFQSRLQLDRRLGANLLAAETGHTLPAETICAEQGDAAWWIPSGFGKFDSKSRPSFASKVITR